MTDAFGKDSHAIAGLDDLVDFLERLSIVDLRAVLLAAVNRDGASRVQDRSQHPVSPQLRVAEEMQRPAATFGDQQPAIHQCVRMIAGKYDGALRRDVVETDDIDAPEKCVGSGADQRNDQTMQQRHSLPVPDEKITLRICRDAVKRGAVPQR